MSSMTVNYLIYSAFLTAACVGILMLIICQLLADTFGKQKIQDNVAKGLLYGVYLSALMCGAVGSSLHESKDHPLWCEIYGLPPCFTVLGSTKAFLYGFFLRRARRANVANIQSTKIWFDVIGPIYIFIYWVLYATLSSIFFTGEPIDTKNVNEVEVVSWCLFNSWKWWLVIFVNIVDLVNCIVTLLLFVYPLLKSVNRLKTNRNTNNKLLLKFINTMKWNVCLSFVATISSAATMAAIPIVKQYIWFFCVGDPFVNAICVFMMMASNRSFFRKQFCKQCFHDHQNSDELSRQTTSPCAETETTKGSYNMDTISPSIMIETETKSVEKTLKLSMLDACAYSQSNQPKRNVPLPQALTRQRSRSF